MTVARSRARRQAPLAAIALALAGSLGLAGCGHAGAGPSTSSLPSASGTSGSGTTGGETTTAPSGGTPHGAASLVWIVTRTALADVASIDPTALRVLEAGRIYEILTPREQPVAGVNAIVTQDFASYAALSSALGGGSLVPGARAVLYDPEDWSATPADEQQHVTTYIGDAVTLAHAHGLQIIVTPALDLTAVVSPGGGASDEVARFLASGVEQAAAAADVVDVQAQSREHDLGSYASFVLQAASIIHARRPGAVVVAGISTNPPSGSVTASQLAAAITAVQGHVQGFWLNIPDHGPRCPGCSTNPDPEAGTGALDAVFG